MLKIERKLRLIWKIDWNTSTFDWKWLPFIAKLLKLMDNWSDLDEIQLYCNQFYWLFQWFIQKFQPFSPFPADFWSNSHPFPSFPANFGGPPATWNHFSFNFRSISLQFGHFLNEFQQFGTDFGGPSSIFHHFFNGFSFNLQLISVLLRWFHMALHI